jgi:hypothetical protein
MKYLYGLLLLLALTPDPSMGQTGPARADQPALPVTVAYSRHFSQGVGFYDAGEFARAAEEFRAAAEINPESALRREVEEESASHWAK